MGYTAEKPIYGNCIIQAPDGQHLCRTSHHRIKWYLDRNLGIVVSENPMTLQLNFEPQNRKINPFHITYKENICVCCGSGDDITRHHIVPRCFLKHFPDHLKKHSSYNVLILCVDCHSFYEEKANILKRDIISDIKLDDSMEKLRFEIKSAGNALRKNYNNIPEDRRDVLLNVLRKHYGRHEITRDDMIEASNLKVSINPKLHYKIVVDSVDVNEFIIEWRKHFVRVMNPRYLPKHWRVDYRD